MSFGDSVAANCEIMLQDVDAACYRITWELFTQIVHRTPVLTGLLKNQWYALASSDFSTEVNISTDKSGNGSLSRITALRGSKMFLGKDGTMTMANNLPYADLAENIGWNPPQWSGKVGPYAMVRLSFVDIAARNP